ncbi:hypothetical protein SLS62_006998 [Diatrype stigma]|uniref:Uncharacterized protein n=1 Tax=Diatrype stigma TaxID=117547 RepID=A0AAN9V031_9PEZI
MPQLKRLNHSPCFSPLDIPSPDFKHHFLNLFKVLNIPSCFGAERVSSVSHSFGAVGDAEGGTRTWFHFLCKNITVSNDRGNPGITYHPGADLAAARHPPLNSSGQAPLPQADYSYVRSGFFLQTTPGGGTTLACFGCTPQVEARLKGFTARGDLHGDVSAEPYILLDIILDGLFQEVDGNVWKMNDVFGAREHLTLVLAHARNEQRHIGKKMPFVELHNIAKHITHLAESVESCILLVDGIIAELDSRSSLKGAAGQGRTGSASTSTTLTTTTTTSSSQLRYTLSYRRSLFKSTELRLRSLSKRVDNAINLAFNMVTQQDSMVMLQDSSSMKIIAAITLLFLPTTTVATVAGSQLFLSSVSEDNNWLIQTSPLFAIMWAIAAPLTLVIGTLALVWYWWTHSENQERVIAMVKRRRGVHG